MFVAFYFVYLFNSLARCEVVRFLRQNCLSGHAYGRVTLNAVSVGILLSSGRFVCECASAQWCLAPHSDLQLEEVVSNFSTTLTQLEEVVALLFLQP